MPLPMMMPPPMPPQGMGGLPMGPPGMGGGASPGMAALLARMGQGAPLPQPPGPPGGSPMDQIMPFLAGSGFQNILAQITKFMKIMTTVGERGDKSVRVPMQGNAGPMDQAAAQMAQARAAMPLPGAMPSQGPAGLPIGLR